MLSMPQDKDVFIDNSFNIEGDPVLPTARAALDPAVISTEFCRVPCDSAAGHGQRCPIPEENAAA